MDGVPTEASAMGAEVAAALGHYDNNGGYKGRGMEWTCVGLSTSRKKTISLDSSAPSSSHNVRTRKPS